MVLANNRDEGWLRPTKTADFWCSNGTCLSGLDQEPGREGGTWFGVNIFGRIGCLVNISAQQDPTKKGRGFLVSDFLTSQEPLESYSQRIAADKDSYNGFTLSLIELQMPGSHVVQVTNDKLAQAALSQTQPTAGDVFAVGNSPINHPWRKMSCGKEKFAQILKSHRHVSSKEKLQEDLFEMMADRSPYMPDTQLEKQAAECDWNYTQTKAKSAVFVWDPDRQYATRTTTVFLVDGQGNCDYIERTLLTPVNLDNPQWSTQHHSFSLQNRPELQRKFCSL